MRVVIISHYHPDFSSGGGELAAYNLYKGIAATPGNEAWFIACASPENLPFGSSFALHRDHEYLIAGGRDAEGLTSNMELVQDLKFVALLKGLRPDVIHFHHYFNVGLELIRVARQTCPRARLVVTLHEFMAICANNGMMVRPDMSLCSSAGPGACQKCLPKKGPDWYFLRERYTKSFFALVDLFISPSHFVAQRYVDWGLPQEKMRVMENGIVAGNRVPPRPLKSGELRTRFAFFGQTHRYKGLDLILEAFGGLPKKLRKTVTLDIHASGLELQKGGYPALLKRLIKKYEDVAKYHGPYAQHDLPQLMQETDWVVMGSIWWENSPIVIQEAWKFGRPVIVPDLGGMAEKVTPGKGGLLYRARDSVALRTLVEQIAMGDAGASYEDLVTNLPAYTSIDSARTEHLKIYRHSRRAANGAGAPEAGISAAPR